VNPDEVAAAEKRALQPFEHEGPEGPYAVQHSLQEMMQELVGIVRQEEEMQRALDGLEQLKARAENAAVAGNREYNNGWHTAIDLHHMLTVSEIITRAALERKESRGAHFRDDYPGKSDEFGKVNIVVRKGWAGVPDVTREPIRAMPEELKAIIQEMS
jgi:succinate dehydrogenase / fumarate reductase flavoprotein subunit